MVGWEQVWSMLRAGERGTDLSVSTLLARPATQGALQVGMGWPPGQPAWAMPPQGLVPPWGGLGEANTSWVSPFLPKRARKKNSERNRRFFYSLSHPAETFSLAGLVQPQLFF